MPATPPPGAQFGLFSSSLVSQQTNRQCSDGPRFLSDGDYDPDGRLARVARSECYRLPTASATETAFRHSGWKSDRARVLAALQAANVRPGRLERFVQCGGDCVAQWSPSRQKHRLKANYCGDRFCVPCSTARGLRVRAKLEALCAGESPLVMEFTLRSNNEPLRKRISTLYSAFVRLRHSVLWKSCVRAGVAVLEVKKGKGSGEWHPHLHVVALGSFMAQKALSDAWLKATGDSPIVWIKRVSEDSGAIAYVTKYATKGWTSEVAGDPESLLECILALRGRRLVSAFGRWHGVRLECDGKGEDDWVTVGKLDRIYGAAVRGESWATGIFISLGGGEAESTRRILERISGGNSSG